MKTLQRFVALITVFFMLSAATVFADPDRQTELMGYFNGEEWDKLNEFIYKEVSADKTSPVDVNILDNAPLWEASKYMFGNCAGPGFHFDEFIDLSSGEPELTEQYKEFAPTMAPYTVMRIGLGNTVNAWATLGPLVERSLGQSILSPEDEEAWLAVEERTIQPKNFSGVTGLLELIEASETMNPDIAFIICLSYVYCTPEDNANLARFLLDDKDESEFGALRAQYGHPEPVKVLAFEFGNETYIRSDYGEEENSRQVEMYCRLFKEHAEEVGKYHPEIGWSLCLMCMDGEANSVWNEAIISELAQYCMDRWDENNRFASLHHYYSGYEMAYVGGRIQSIIDSFNKIAGEGHKFKALFTEHAKWSKDFAAATNFGAGLATAGFFNIVFQWDEFTSFCANYYCWYSYNLWNSFRVSPKDGELIRSGVDHVYEKYIQHCGDTVFKALTETLDDSEIADPTSTAQQFLVLPMGKGDKTMKLLCVNRSDSTEVDARFVFESGKSYKLVEEDILTTPNKYSFAYSADTEDVYRNTINATNVPNFSQYTFAPHSLTVLTLECSNKIAQLGDENGDGDSSPVYEGESHFSDINYYWGANEIDLLAEAGIINGSGIGTYEPDAPITRAEFAALINRTEGLPHMDISMGFNDVSETNWFNESVNAVVAAGYMKGVSGESFAPESYITLADAAVTINRAMSSTSEFSNNISSDEVLKPVRFSTELSDWEKECFAKIIHSGMFDKFYESSVVEKDRFLTRGEAAVLIYRLKAKKGV